MNSESSPARRAAAARSIIHRAPSRGSSTTCRLASETPTFMSASPLWSCRTSSAALPRSAGDAARFDQLETGVVRALEERDARAAGVLDRPFEQFRAETGEARDVGLEVDGVEAEVLEAVMGHRVAIAEALVGARAGDVHVDPAVGALATQEPITEDSR